MSRNDLLERSAPRAELDRRSRETRLRLEHATRLFMARPLPEPSLLRRVLRRLGSKIQAGHRSDGQSARANLTGTRPDQGRRTQGRAVEAADGFPASPPLPRPACRSRSWS